MTTRSLTVLVLAAVAFVAGFFIWSVRDPDTYLVQGEVEATRIDLSATVTARVAETPVGFGDRIAAGDVAVQLESPQLMAQLATAQAAVAVAEANRDVAFATRPETIAAAEAQLARATSNVALAQSNYDRVSQLRAGSVVSQANLEQVTNTLESAIQAQAAAQADLDQARNGASPEQRAVASAQVAQAEANLAQLQASADEMTVTSPIDGEVTTRPAEVGKLFSAGAPLISIVDVDNAWFTFNLREDLLEGLAVGQILEVRVPALGAEAPAIPAAITAINVEGSYANWRATRATGDFDLRTFSVRAEPTDPVEGLRPGMSALVDWPATARSAD